MGKLTDAMMRSATGMLGGRVVFRQLRGVTIFSSAPGRRVRSTEKQKKVMNRFKAASEYANEALADPVIREKYQAAVSGKSFSARLVAMKDFFNPPMVTEISAFPFTGKAGDDVVITAYDDFEVTQVLVTVLLGDEILETGAAVQVPLRTDRWSYIFQKTINEKEVTIRAVAYDRPGNTGTLETKLVR